MSLVLLGLNHKTAPVEMRERFSFSDSTVGPSLKELVDGAVISEGVILSTCNRTEIMAWGGSSSHDAIIDRINGFLARTGNFPDDSFKKYLYTYSDEEAARHLFEVSCGLDSMILGEGQILGQVKKAFSDAQSFGYTGAVLNRFLNTAIKSGKRARTETAICKGASSISFAAVELAKRIFGDLTNCRILLIGAGKMSELAVKLLISSGVQFVMVANRTMDKAKEIADAYGGRVIPFDELQNHLLAADVVISSTSAPHFVLKRDMVAASMKLRRGRPLFIVDIAVPRDVEPSAGELDNVYLYNIDDLKEAVNQNLIQRSQEIEKVKRIMEEELADFRDFLKAREVAPLIRSIRQSFEEQGKRELERFASKDSLSEREKKLLESFCGCLLSKLLHKPTVRLKEMAKENVEAGTFDAVRGLFETPEDRREVE